MTNFSVADFSLFSHHHLPIIAAYCRTLDLKGVVDRLVLSSTDLSAGMAVQAMVLRILSCSSPLYWENQDRILLFGDDVDAHLINETNLGRVLETLKVLALMNFFWMRASRVLCKEGTRVINNLCRIPILAI